MSTTEWLPFAPEIRLLILKHFFASSKYAASPFLDQLCDKVTAQQRRKHRRDVLNLFLTCKQAYIEARPVFLRQTTFVVTYKDEGADYDSILAQPIMPIQEYLFQRVFPHVKYLELEFHYLWPRHLALFRLIEAQFGHNFRVEKLVVKWGGQRCDRPWMDRDDGSYADGMYPFLRWARLHARVVVFTFVPSALCPKAGRSLNTRYNVLFARLANGNFVIKSKVLASCEKARLDLEDKRAVTGVLPDSLFTLIDARGGRRIVQAFSPVQQVGR